MFEVTRLFGLSFFILLIILAFYGFIDRTALKGDQGDQVSLELVRCSEDSVQEELQNQDCLFMRCD